MGRQHRSRDVRAMSGYPSIATGKWTSGKVRVGPTDETNIARASKLVPPGCRNTSRREWLGSTARLRCRRAAGYGRGTWCRDLGLISALPWPFHDVGRLKALGPRRALWSRGAGTDRRRFPRCPRFAHPRLAQLRWRRGNAVDRRERTWACNSRLAGCWRWSGTDSLRGGLRIRGNGYRLAGRRRWSMTDTAGHASGCARRARGARSARCSAGGARSANLRQSEC
jgi:hypothetical protein